MKENENSFEKISFEQKTSSELQHIEYAEEHEESKSVSRGPSRQEEFKAGTGRNSKKLNED